MLRTSCAALAILAIVGCSIICTAKQPSDPQKVQSVQGVQSDGHDQSETLEQRVLRQDEDAFLEVANQGRKDMIPTLEKFAHDETAARMALAKLGVKQYLDEFVTDLTSTNSSLLNSWRGSNLRLGMRTEYAEREAELTAKGKALDRLVYIGDKSSVKYIAAELYNTNCPNRGNSDDLLMSRTPIAWLAARALSQMHLENAPRPSDEGDPEWLNYIEAWKKWWEKNKTKYP
jgi:hypothetical protein